MADPTKTFTGVTPACWNCVQETSEKQDHTVYTPPPPSNQGTSSTKVLDGHVDLNFSYDGVSSVTYVLTHYDFPVTPDKVWEGIQDMINGCNK